MKKISVRNLVPWVALSLVVMACAGGNSLTTTLASKLETGTISFVSPVDGAVFHQDVEATPPSELVLISSTFDTDKNITIITEFGPTQCLVLANQTTPCGEVPYLVGENSLTAEAKKLDGQTVVSAKTSFTWVPYTSMDKFVATVTGNKGGDPTLGYMLISFLISVVAAVILAIKAGKWGALLGFFLPLIALAFFTTMSASAVSAIVVNGIFGLAGSGLILFGVVAWINKGHVISGPQGSKTWVTFPNGVNAGKENWHSGYVGPGEHSPKLNDPGVDLLEAGRKAGFAGLPDQESYNTPLKLEK